MALQLGVPRDATPPPGVHSPLPQPPETRDGHGRFHTDRIRLA
jgi:hypothetical protein